MNTTNDEPLRILRFWRDLEIFNIPAAPSKRDSSEQTKVDTFRCGKSLPRQSGKFAPTGTVGYVHVVYLGVADTEDLSRLLLRGIFPDRDLSERERQRVTGNGWLAAFVVDQLGRPKPDSYFPASFAHGVAALRETRALDNINARLERAKEEFAQRRHQLPENQEQEGAAANAANRAPTEAILDWEDLDEELRIARGLLGEAANDPNLDWRVVVRTSRIKKRYLDDSLQAATDFLNSFYLDDLDRLIAQAEKKLLFGKALSAYLGSALPERQRVDILTDNTAMAGLVSAKRLPSARWPTSSKYPLVLAQQAAVSQVIGSLGKAEGLIGVNGPPGTGKTTLLCDVIAEIVTERARRIAALNRPVALFEDKMTVAGKGFFPLKAEVVVGTSIVVTSTNNNAVKNITQELPARKKVADEFGSADYFADVMHEVFRAQKVLDGDKQPIETCGVIAAALGNVGNRRSFAQGFFRDERLPQRQAEEAQGDEQLAGADLADEETKEPSPADDQPPSMKQILEAASGKYPQYQKEWQEAKEAFMALEREFESCRGVLEWAEKVALHIDDERSRLNGLTAEEQALGQGIQARAQALSENSARAALERELETHRRALQADYAMGAKHFPDAQFWALPGDTRHRASVAVGPKLDELRAKLFLQAVDLHRLTVLANAGKFIANLRAVNGMLTGGSRDKLSPEHRPLLWDAFFFVVPVVSTTLASFDRLFVDMGQNSLGWLLIDEAGQATPQSAAGAIWRSRRAVIVGDPLQIEPVFTVPRSLTEELRRRHDVALHWSPIDESVQTLADRVTPFGSWVERTSGSSPTDAPERLWTGMPLRTHRRCDDPMFSVANSIAYADQMVQGRVDKAGQPTPWDFSCSLGKSAWLDVRSSRVNHPVSEDEIACLLDCLTQLQREKNGKAKVYVISPFRKVAQACRKCVGDAGFGGIECGTVHTFQGKEAHIVFLMLGTAPGQTGSGARGWAASKPNLLNVAVTRAQCRLYVIGDADQWGGEDYFRELLHALPRRSVEVARDRPSHAGNGVCAPEPPGVDPRA